MAPTPGFRQKGKTVPVPIFVGTSGYSYPDWVGPFYPRGTSRGSMLSLYAGCFSTVELNFTYYRIPDPGVVERMVERTPEGFTFFVKAHRGITHEGPPEDHIPAFLRCLEPARRAGRLGGVLLQFPQSFHNTREHRATLERIVDALAGHPLVVEVRHDCWIREDFFEFLRERGIAFSCVDEPEIEGLVPRLAVVTGSIGYLRFHSRNARNWYAGDDRYDYDYSEIEMREWLPKLHEMAAGTTAVYVFFNNCHRANAVRNAITFRRLLGQEVRPPARMQQKRLF